MLEQVRRRMKSGATYVLVAGLTVIFMFFFGVPTQNCGGGGPGQGRGTNAHVATVAGSDIYSKDINLIYNRVFSSSQTDEDQYEQRRASSLRNLILVELFASRAKDAGLRVGKKELANYIQSAARNVEYRYTYGRSGSFNGHYYKAYVQNRLRSSIADYENFKRKELLARKYLASRAAQSAVPGAELEQGRRIKETSMNLAFVGLSTSKLRESVEVTDDEVSKFLENNGDKVQSYYEDNKEEYSESARMKVRRIYIAKPGDSASDDKKEKAKQNWEEAQTRVFDDGESVGDVAADLDESYSENERGMMGWSETGNMDQNIVDALEGEDVGTTKRVSTKRANMIVKLEDYEEARTQPLDEVDEQIARTLIQQDRVQTLVAETKKTLQQKAKETGSLKKALSALKEESDKQVWKDLSVQETGDFTLESQGPPPGMAAQLGGQLAGMGSSWSQIPKIGDSQKLAVDAFKNLSEDNPVPEQAYEVGDSTYIVRLKSKTTPEDGDSGSAEDALESKKVNELVGRWSALFGSANGRLVPPMPDYGPWIERQLTDALDQGTVTIHEKNSTVAQRTKQMLEPGSAPSQGGGKSLQLGGGSKGKQKGPIKIGGGEGGGDSKSINIEDLKKKLKGAKQQKKAPSGGSQESGGGSEGTSSEGN
jgi:hypothetical protein